MRASDTLADSRVQKPKNFLAFFSRLLPPPLRREAEKEMERKFLVLLRRFRLRNELVLFYHLTLRLRSLVVVTKRMWIVQGTNKSVCACPARPVRTQIPVVFRRYYKTAGIASHTIRWLVYFVHHLKFSAEFVLPPARQTLQSLLLPYHNA